MSTKRASEDLLGRLHQKLAEVMLECLDGQEIKDPETGEVTILKTENPALFTAVAKFLKDNNITAIPEASDALEKLKEKLKQSNLPLAGAGDLQWPANQRTMQ